MKVVSGGQTGADRAALDVAIEMGIPHGGWCPTERRAEDGELPARYLLIETPKSYAAQRTEWNVRDSDGTLILNTGPLDGGSLTTKRLAEKLAKPCLVIQTENPESISVVKRWLETNHIEVLNVAGPRESKRAGIYEFTKTYLTGLFQLTRA